MTKPIFYFFGCMHSPGHFLHTPSGMREYDYKKQPWPNLDGGLQPKGGQVQGPALLHHKDGWTCLSFWDRTIDTRGGCNGNFLTNQTLDFGEMITMAREQFPQVMARFPFAIALVE